jgi:hypothetical protein
MIGKLLLQLTICGQAFALMLFGAAPSLAQDPNAWNGAGQLLVYRNGNLLHGQIERELGRYVVLTSSGSRIVVPVDQVDFVGSSLEEVCQLKRERLPPITDDTKTRPNARIEFFQWCLKQGLFAEAERELTELQMSRLPASELYAYLRQLHSAMERAELARATPPPALPPSSLQPTTGPAAINSAVVVTDLPPVETPLATVLNHPQANPLSQPASAPPERGELIKAVSYEEPIASAPASSALPVPELEQLLKQLPTEGVSLFKRRVEPLLFRNCSNAGCHDPEKTRLPLQRLARGEGIPKRMSQQNLIQVLRFVGSGVEGDSPLLTASVTAHGGAVKSPLKLDSEHYRLLAAWVERMAIPSKTAGIGQTHSPQFSAAALPAEDRPPADARPLVGSLMSPEPGPTASATETSLPVTRPPEIPQLEKQSEAYIPTDPFDPTIFNRRRHPSPPTGSNTPAPGK